MSVRTYLDKDFFHRLAQESDESIRDLIVGRFAGYQYSLYVSAELVEEMIGLLETQRSERLRDEATLLLRMMHHRMFRYYGDLVIEELRTGAATPFADAGTVRRLLDALKALAEGREVSSLVAIPQQVRERKQRDRDELNRSRDNFLKDLKQQLNLDRPPPMTFAQYRERYWAKWIGTLLRHIAERDNIESAESRIAEIVVGTTKYPYTNAAMRIHMAVLYRSHMLGRKVGDMYDAQQAVLLVGMDLLVTDDGGMKELCELVYGPSLNILDYGSFVEEQKQGTVAQNETLRALHPGLHRQIGQGKPETS